MRIDVKNASLVALVGILSAFAVSFAMHGTIALLRNFCVYFTPIAICAPIFMLKFSRKGKNSLLGGMLGIGIGLVLDVMLIGASVWAIQFSY